MKKIITVLLLAGMAFSLASCMNRNKDSATNSSQSGNISPSAVTTTAEGVLESAFEGFLTNMIPVYGVNSAEEVKSYFVGTEMETVTEKDEDTGEEFSYEMPKNEPGPLALNNPDEVQNQTMFPLDSVDRIQNAAIFYNLMNMNNGTFSAFKLKDEAELTVFADRVQSNIKSNQWICGFPERFLIMRTDDVLICAYGLEASMNAWKAAVISAYKNAEVLYEESLH
jgi:hypothetical protein